MKIPNLENDIALSTYGGTGHTIQEAIEDALSDYQPQSKHGLVVVIIKILEEVNNYGNDRQTNNILQ